MNKNYLTSTHSGFTSNSLRKVVFAFLFLVTGWIGYAQSTITITTTSNFVAWNLSYSNPTSGLTWTAVGPGINLTDGPTFTPTFNFSPNAANGLITVSTSDTPANFAGITIFQADNPIGLEITTIDVTDLPNLEDLRLTDNLLTSIDLSGNPNLRVLNLKRNDLSSIDLSANPLLEEVYLDANQNIASLDISNNPNLTTLSAAALLNITTLDISNNPDLISLNLAFVPLTSTAIDNILNQLDAFGKLNGNLDLQNTTGGVITKNGIQAYINLLSKGWTIKPPQGFDFGDAPDSYFTTIANNGPIHLVDDLHDELRLGSSKDKESDGLVSANADGDDNDNYDDEDGVALTEFNGIQTSTTNISIDVTILNNYANNSYLHAWLDLDRNGTFDPDEYATLTIAPNTGVGTVTLNWNITALGADIVEGQSYARFRFTKDNDLTASSVGGYATGGEVEDYSFTILGDFDGDGIPDITDVDDDNDGILDTVEDNGTVDRDTDGDGMPDRIDLDADGDGCFDVDEAGFTNNGANMLGTANPPVVDATGKVTSTTDGYTAPNDLNGSGTPDFQEAGAAATITTQPVDQDLIIGTSTFSVVATADTYQWEESQDGGTTWTALTDGGDYAGTTTADLVVTNTDVSKLNYRYRVIVSNIGFACDPTTTSTDAGYITPDDFDGDGIYDIVDVDDDNDGIFDIDEDNGTVDRDTDGDGMPDRIDLDADGDGCFDVTEAGFTDGDGDGILGSAPVTVDATGKVTSGTDGYTTPNDLNGSGTPDFQEAGTAATITTQPVDQTFIIGDVTFSVVATADTYQWQFTSDGTTWQDLSDGPDVSGSTTASITITNNDLTHVNDKLRVVVSNIGFACDPTTTSDEVGFITPGDFDHDGVPDVVDVDDDNDGILDTVEDNGTVDRDTDGDGMPDRIDLDADGDGCPDVTEAGFTNNGADMLGTVNPPAVDATGKVTSATDGYTLPADNNGNGIPDFQEAGAAATITTQPVNIDFALGTISFTVTSDADTYQWQVDTQDGSGFTNIVDNPPNITGANTPTLSVIINDASAINYKVRVIVSNSAYACDPTTTSDEVGFNTPGDFDGDGVVDVIDVDDDNDGILDTVEDNGTVDRDTDGDGMPDRIDLDADGDGCYDVKEAGFTDGDGDGILGSAPVTVDATGKVTSGTDGYTTPNDLDANGTPDFQEAGAAATITTQPADQNLMPGGTATFDVVAVADTYQWEESTDGGTTWTALTDGGNYSGTTTASLMVSNLDVAMVNNKYRVLVNNIAFACDPVTASATVGFISLPDFDGDNVPDIVDVDDDNDGILDTVEDNGTVDRDTDGDGMPDRIDLDADGDGCFDVKEAGFTDGDGDGILGSAPVTVDATGKVTSGTDGYTTPNDLDNNGTPDFQEAGVAATITTQPVDQDFNYGSTATFSTVTTGDTYQWEESTDNGVTWTALTEGGDYTGVHTNQLTVSNADINMYFNDYRVLVSNIAFACDSGTYSDVVSYNALPDTDGDGIFDVIDVDDDNDGILDTVEENGDPNRDTDGDGVVDRLDLDADGDLCPDVSEAGFTNNGNDMLGTKNPPDVDAEGKVTSATDGYTTPNDLNNNGTPDFQEAGSPSAITSQPSDIEVTLGDNAVFSVSGNATYYQWQVSENDGSTWNDIMDNAQYSGTQTNTLTVIAARGRVESNLYRVILRTPDYACDPNPELISEAGKLMFNQAKIPNGFSPNGDGENDVFSIPGLDQYPNFKMKVFDRWGNMVYHYENNGSRDPRWWDGHAKGSMVLSDGERVPAGTYYYMIDYNDGSTKPIKGWVYVNY